MARLVKTEQVAEALVKAGVINGPLDQIYRIVIDIKADELPAIYVEYISDERILDVIPALVGIEVKHA